MIANKTINRIRLFSLSYSYIDLALRMKIEMMMMTADIAINSNRLYGIRIDSLYLYPLYDSVSIMNINPPELECQLCK